MRPSLRFLALAVLGWAGFRAASLGAFSDLQLLHVAPGEAKAPPPLAQTQFPAIDPVEPAPANLPVNEAVPPQPAQPSIVPVQYVRAAIGQPVAMRPGVVTVYKVPAAAPSEALDLPPRSTRYAGATYTPAEYTRLPPLDLGSLSHFASSSGPTSQPANAVVGQSVPALEKRRIDRLQLSTWAMLRQQQTGVAGSRSIAPLGQLGASQGGARLLYNVNRLLALSGRLSTEVGRRGGEAAAGVRIHPFANIPVWITAERRQAIGKYGGGRSAFALFAESGVYGKPVGWHFLLDGYLEGGIVGARSRDLFVDGGLTVTRPLFRNFSGGFGVWGGAQPHLARLDVGPRLTMRVRKNVKMHLDWRQKIVGNARPGSGPAVTLAGDF